ncbi:MAG: glucose 1-dehydrogenase [Rhodospirillaceae bacterium]|mgnify:FL=1|jgi:NAD(P)-dependent dehydrogenase (short-subunit alcohol dehydrogenase family)|nr:glucose 1-dehydrogenase [Rhodospirillaceae bacterium]MBT4042854.1 glucose 1-dehydrogenase [Rhodospirillaceae bacterium]MBT4687283.1 glucose 1-dehydrogenase [Rhodospirillaceae bacterium]MBT5081377.1 glucose 1-dehydrogenase [Rhodospirillaceae bacterium]MBT5522861.1 glucose 1-dehydrogenase [Rhodospirillaceae bacterium]
MGLVSGKVAMVTGGGSGIGRACAETLAREGASLVITDIDADGMAATVAGIKEQGGTAISLPHDVRDEEQWQTVLAEVKSRCGGLHILVNNAGIGIGGPLLEMSLEDWRHQNAINLDGVFLGTKHGIPLIDQSGGGSIIIMSSVAGLRGSPGLAGYSASKGGVRLFSKSAALECAAAGLKVRINSVHPGIIDTPIWTKLRPGTLSGGANAIDPEALANGTVAHRAGRPQEIADGVLYLASDLSSYVNGSELVIDGGMMAGGGGRSAMQGETTPN